MQVDRQDLNITYCGLMEEVKRRTDVILHVLQAPLGLPQIVVYELCYLQLRKMCELIGLACLVAHGDIPGVQSPALQKAYKADDIIKQLGNLHPTFYPKPGKQVIDPSTGKVVRLDPVTDPYLTKTELIRLYGECGNVLHRGSLKKILREDQGVLDLSPIRKWVQKFTALLTHHQIQLFDTKLQLWVLMNAKEDGRVHAFIFQAIGVEKPS